MTTPQTVTFKFFPTRFSWAAIHPEPIGIVYFVGGAFFGSFPTLFYRFLLKKLFLEGYTVVALPFKFSFRHWAIALGLVENQDDIRQSLLEAARKQGYKTDLYEQQLAAPGADIKEYWIGHSLGCKYIALLELLTDYEISGRREAMQQCLGEQQTQLIDQLIDKSALPSVSLYNQPSILLDPVISDLDNAIPIKAVRSLFSKLIKVLPSRQETFHLIEQSNLFALTSIIAFDSKVAQTSVTQLQQLLRDRLRDFHPFVVKQSWLGKHLAVLGTSRGDALLIEAILTDLSRSRSRPAMTSAVAASTPDLLDGREVLDQAAEKAASITEMPENAPISLSVELVLKNAQA